MKRRAGYTLVEVMISMLLTAVMVGAVFSVALTGQTSGLKVDHRILSSQYSRHLTETLAQFNTADYSATSTIPGPASAAAVPASWYLGGNPGTIKGEDGRIIQDDCGSCTAATACTTQAGCNWTSQCYALSQATHTLKQFLPAWFESAPYNACIQYYVPPVAAGQTVQLAYGGAPATQSQALQATVTLNWTEP